MLVVDPPRAVMVEQSDGTWPGWLSAWRRADTGWRAFVQYRRGPGMAYLHWVEAKDVSPCPTLLRGTDGVLDASPAAAREDH